jgi:hypothetical protein
MSDDQLPNEMASSIRETADPECLVLHETASSPVTAGGKQRMA